MKNKFTLLASIIAILFVCSVKSPVLAQESGQEINNVIIKDAEMYPGIQTSLIPQNDNSKAMWDVLFNHNLTNATSKVGWAGVGYIGGEIWVSKWASDTLARLTPQGALTSFFTIPGLSGVRSFTSDGTNLYAGANTTTIYRINPTTRTLNPPHITVAANARWVTYDATLNSGAGGFWYGNFDTDITAVSMTGAVLSTIPLATHTLSGMYGAAVDNVSAGGPYLWFFSQSGTNYCQIVGIKLPAGTPTSYTRDAFTDLGPALSLTSGLAGGLFLSNSISSGNIALVGVLQGTPSNSLFAYDVETVAGIGDKNGNNTEFEIYPNPSKGIYNLELTDKLLNSRIIVMDITGRMITEFTSDNNNRLVKMDLSFLQQGVYYVMIDNGNVKTTQKIIKY